MKRFLPKLLLCLTLILPLHAQEQEEKQRVFNFFSDEVPRYEGFAAGGFLYNQYALGGWSDFAVTNLGGGLDAEYTVPAFLPYNLDLGASLHLEAGHTFPKADTTLKSHDDIRLYAATFLRIPFTFLGQNFAFQPELGWGVTFNHCVGQKHSLANGWYTDQIITFSPALRYMPPIEALSTVEFELSPYWSISPEKASEAVNFLGFRIGVVWHLQDFFKARKNRTDKEELHIEEAEPEPQKEEPIIEEEKPDGEVSEEDSPITEENKEDEEKLREE